MFTETYSATSWVPQRKSPTSRKGMVAAKMPQAAQIGADVLAAGGNAVDAAVATAFALGVCEPWMNGIGGGGYMVVWLAKEQRALVIDYAMLSPAAATADMYPPSSDAATAGALFTWPSTEGNRHVMGPHSIAVPGTVAGLSLALEQFGTWSLADVLAPAIALAEGGFPVTWHTTQLMSKFVKSIRSYPETARIMLDADGDIPVTAEQAKPVIIRQPELAATLRTIANYGPDAFYRGPIGHAIADYLAAQGTILTPADLENYQPRILAPNTTTYHGHTIYTNTGGSGGTSLTQALTALNLLDNGVATNRSATQWHGLAHVFRQAFADRYTYLADPDRVEVPIESLLSEAYAQATVAGIGPRAIVPIAGDRKLLGVHHTLAASVPEFMRDGSTTNLSVIDGEGNAVSLTQTLLAVFGSFVTIPGTGILMNNGMMWFDPEPGRPNSVAGNKRPLNNMAPSIIVKDGEVVASLGASGGRKIMNCNAQQIMNIVDAGMDAQTAIDTPRIDCSTCDVLVSTRMLASERDGIASLGYPLRLSVDAILLGEFSSPTSVHRRPDGTLDGGTDSWYMPATVIGVQEDTP